MFAKNTYICLSGTFIETENNETALIDHVGQDINTDDTQPSPQQWNWFWKDNLETKNA